MDIGEVLIKNTLIEFQTLITNAQEVQERYQFYFLSSTNVPRRLLSEEMPSNYCLNPTTDIRRKGNILISITGDSISFGLRKNRMLSHRNIKVRPFPEARINSMYSYIALLLLKKPNKVILHISTNDAPFMDSNKMLKCIFDLKEFSLRKLPTVKILLSHLRIDNSNSNENNNNFIQLNRSSESSDTKKF